MKTLITTWLILNLLTGCSIYSAINAPAPVSYESIKIGHDRMEVISVLGTPKLSDTKGIYTTDSFEFIDGNHAGYKARVLPYLAGDLITVGLAEIIFWPLEKLALDGSSDRAIVTYDMDNKVNSIKVNKKNDGELLYLSEAPKAIKIPSKINVPIAITPFNCNCDVVVKESVQDSIIDTFFKANYGRPVKGDIGDIGDIVIKGTITMTEGASNHSDDRSSGSSSMSISPSRYGYGSYGSYSSGSYGSGYSSSEGHKTDSSSSGIYLSVITIQAYKNGQIVASESIGQNLGNGQFLSAQTMANQGASSILTQLVRKNIIQQ